MSKYSFKPYNPQFPQLFENEKQRLQHALGNDIQIEHIGSTAVPGLGGKGIIDIAIGVARDQMQKTSDDIVETGYEYKSSGDENRLFHLREDAETYHVHVIDKDHPEWQKNISFRDWLRNHPDDSERYAESKKHAAKVEGVDKEKYMKVKEPVIRDILKKISDAS